MIKDILLGLRSKEDVQMHQFYDWFNEQTTDKRIGRQKHDQEDSWIMLNGFLDRLWKTSRVIHNSWANRSS